MLRRTTVVLAGTLLVFAGCSTGSSGTPHPPAGGGAGGFSTSDAGGGAAGTSTSDAGGDAAGAAISCSAPSTSYAGNGGACGKWRWGVKTGTDHDVGKVDMTPVVTTIQALRSLKTPSVHYCYRTPDELKTYELRDVTLKFEHLENDSDYHLIASDSAGNSMIVEVPYPGCVGTNSCQSGTPWLCEITHARAAVDAKNPGAKSYAKLGVGSVVGVGFFDTFELGNASPPAGMAPNGIELHPVLGICFGTGCDPLKE